MHIIMLQATVTQLGYTNPRSSSVMITVHVLDVNNHSPVFPTSNYILSVPEGTCQQNTILQVFVEANQTDF